MPKFHVSRTTRTYETGLLCGTRTGAFSDETSGWNVIAKNAAQAEAKARAEGGAFRVDEVLKVEVEPFEDWWRNTRRLTV